MKTLVTGASGFIGRHVLEAAQAHGLRVFPLIRPSSSKDALETWKDSFRFADLRDPRQVEEAARDVDVVIHLAGLTRARNAAEFRRVNAQGVADLVHACRRTAPGLRRFLLVSSLSAGGPSTAGRARVEADPPSPCSAYGSSKLGGEEALRENAGPIPWTIVRPPIVYGPWERDLFTVFRMSTKGIVPILGREERHYSICYGPDLARAVVELALHPDAAGEVFHVAEERAYTYPEIVGQIGEAVGRRPWMPRIPAVAARAVALGGSITSLWSRRPSLVSLAKLPEMLAPAWTCSTEKARRLLGTVCPTPFQTGACATAAWYRERGWLPAGRHV